MRWVLVLGATLAGCTRLGFVIPPDASPDQSTVRETSQVSDRSPADRPPDLWADLQPDLARPDLAPPPWTGFSVFNFKAGWVLPHTLTWLWQCSGDVPDFDHYELCVAKSLDALATSPSCATPFDDPTLVLLECKGGPGYWHLGQRNDLEPSTTYYGQLHVVDKKGVRWRSAPIASATVAVPPDRYPIWTEDFPQGSSSWGLKRSPAKPGEGSYGLTAQPTTAGAWYELDLAGLAIKPPGLDDTRLKQAYLEFLIDSPNGVRLHTFFQRTDGAYVDYAPPAGYSVADAKLGYQRIEVPLRRMVWRGTTAFLTASEVTAGTLSHVIVGSLFQLGTVYLDEISIRY